MKKRVLSFVMAVVMLLSFGAGIVPEVKAEELPSYNAQHNFGDEVFTYYSRDITTGINSPLTYVEAETLYKTSATGSYIGPYLFSVGITSNVNSMMTWTAPYSGTITISNALAAGIENRGKQWDKTNYEECYAKVYGTDWSLLASYTIPAGPDPVETPDIVNIKVTAGQNIKFLAGSNGTMNCYLYWIPQITYTEIVHTHQWEAQWQSNETHHWHNCSVEYCDATDDAQKDGYGSHLDVDKDTKCDTCGYQVALSYHAQNDFGNGVFTYYSRNIQTGVNALLTYVEADNLYKTSATGSYIGPNLFSVGITSNVNSMMTWTAPYSGTITISNAAAGGIANRGKQWNKTDFEECYAKIYGTDWSLLASYAIPAGPDPVETPDIVNIKVTAGQNIKFLAGSNGTMNCYLYWIPVITYTEIIHTHQWEAQWQSNETYHWHNCSADDCGVTDSAQKDGYAPHEDADKDAKCDTCGYAVALTYHAQNDFGNETFTYFSRNIQTGANSLLTYVEAEKLYKTSATGSYIGPNLFSVGITSNVNSMMTWTAPYSGTITISNAAAGGIANRGKQWNKTNFEECYAKIHGTDWSLLASYAIPAGPDPVETPDIVNIKVTAGQNIKFLAGSNGTMNCYLYWIPVITYTEIVHTHQWDAQWQSNETHHWHNCGAEDCGITDDAQKDGYAPHADADKDAKCDTCGYNVALVYNAENDFGNEVFTYYSRDITNGSNSLLTYVEAENLYKTSATGSYIGPNLFSVGITATVNSMLVFTAPYSGTITISNAAAGGIANRGKQWDKTNFEECYAKIYSPKWLELASYAIPANADPVATPDIVNIRVNAGDNIKFLAGSNGSMNCYLYWIPQITYTEIAVPHEWSEQWQSNEKAHWHECTDASCELASEDMRGYGYHYDDNGDYLCDVCGYGQTGVEFEAREPMTYYISSSEGDNTNDGLSAQAPWKSVDKLTDVKLYAGDTVLFKSGDVWYGTWDLDLSRGTQRNPITFAVYGEGAKPDFRYYSDEIKEKTSGICLVIRNANGFVMDGLSVGNANLGVKLRYDSSYYESDYVRITNCYFHDIYGVTQMDNVDGIYFSAGIATEVESSNWKENTDAQGNNWPLRGLYVDNCVAYDAGALVCGPSGVYGFYMTDCVAEECGYYGTTAFGCQNGYIDRCVFKNNGTREMPAGSCGIMISATDFAVKNTVIFGQQRQNDNPDGCGIDFERNCQNVTVTNCLLQNNAGVGVMYFTSGELADGTNVNTNVFNSYFINNNQNMNPDGEIAGYDIFATYYATSECTVSGNKYYFNATEGSGTTSFAYKQVSNDLTLTDNTMLNTIPANLEMMILGGGMIAEVDEYNVSLDDNLNLNFYLDVSDYYLDNTVISVAFAGEQNSYNIAELTKNEDGKYLISVELAAAQMTEEVVIKVVTGGTEISEKSYTVRQYADYILDDANGFAQKDKDMVMAMLQYGASAQKYFDINEGTLANAGYTDTVADQLPDVADYSAIVSSSIEGIRFYGASLLFKNKIGIRFYFTITGDNAYTVNGQSLTQKEDLWYIEISDITPQNLDQLITVTISDNNGGSFTVSYSPIHYIVRQYNKTGNAELKELVQNLFDYYKAAEAYVA